MMAFELCLLLFHAALLGVQNFNVYHAAVADNCHRPLFAASLLLLGARLVRAQLASLQASPATGLAPETVGPAVLLLAQLAGAAAWLGRRLVERSRPALLLALAALPAALWTAWRLAALRRMGRPAPGDELESPGGPARRFLRFIVWQMAFIVEQSLVSGYVIGFLPPAFAGEHLFFDWVRCGAFAVSAACSTGLILAMWTLHCHLPRLHALWAVLGAWERVSDAAAGVPSWNGQKTYALGARVSHGGAVWKALGPNDSNLATPGAPGAALLLWWLGENVLRPFNVVICMQAAIVAFHVVSAAFKAHYVADLIVGLLNLPIVAISMYWRRVAIEQLSSKDADAGSADFQVDIY